MHPTAFDYLKPTDEQAEAMQKVRDAAKQFALVLKVMLPDGPDKTFVLRSLRTTAMWANVALTRNADGEPLSNE